MTLFSSRADPEVPGSGLTPLPDTITPFVLHMMTQLPLIQSSGAQLSVRHWPPQGFCPMWTVPSRTVNWCNHREQQCRGLLRVKNGVAVWPSNPSSGHIPKWNTLSLLKWHLHTCVFTAVLFKMAKTGKQPGCCLKGEWWRCGWCMYNGNYFATKRTEILPYVTTQLELNDIMLMR